MIVLFSRLCLCLMRNTIQSFYHDFRYTIRVVPGQTGTQTMVHIKYSLFLPNYLFLMTYSMNNKYQKKVFVLKSLSWEKRWKFNFFLKYSLTNIFNCIHGTFPVGTLANGYIRSVPLPRVPVRNLGQTRALSAAPLNSKALCTTQSMCSCPHHHHNISWSQLNRQ